ncbi:N-(5'-phosphoribosyl)anthranilate isomerase [bacterium CG17_big_fil_post_rev_8_21_14_2_50_64_8]|nr:MAG: N-(5'-phosphoribosyl)anthranilate isomerase [bacterium CG17_big_fil_post_rev_8_21_14_2_50_64_8]PJA74141.1 MAG: N-(5'-phosphoribosyl)anthranilate isomerase [bacterium CG_4_9_14_3_um_filter_65_15]
MSTEKVQVKICGLTSAADAVACSSRGADFLGLVFADSPRRVTVAQARKIRAAVPRAKLVGVFVDMAIEEVAEIVQTCRLDIVQLHGREDGRYRTGLGRLCPRPVIKALRLQELALGDEPGMPSGVDTLLLDLDKSGNADAEAERLALWDAAAEQCRAGRRVFLAGGLTPQNVADAVRRTRPAGVDVSSGVERSPGNKDPEAVNRFIEEVHRASA